MRAIIAEPEHLVLSGPLRRQVGEASNPHALGEPAIDGGFDQIGGKESHRICCAPSWSSWTGCLSLFRDRSEFWVVVFPLPARAQIRRLQIYGDVTNSPKHIPGTATR